MARVKTAQKPKTNHKKIDPVNDELLSPIDRTMFQSTSDNSVKFHLKMHYIDVTLRYRW